MRLRGLRSVIAGEAGILLALALAFVAALTSFIAAAGPREQTASQNGATRTAAAALPAIDRTILVHATWSPQPSFLPGILTPLVEQEFTTAFSQSLNPGIPVAAGSSRVFVSGPLLAMPPHSAPPQATLSKPPVLQLSADSNLEADSELVAGRWPAGTSSLPGNSAAAPRALVLQAALTRAIATKFGVHPGMLLSLGMIGGRLIELQVTGIIQPKASAIFWSSAAAQAVPAVEGNGSQFWYLGGAVVSENELQALQDAWPGLQAFADFYFPVSVQHLTQAGLSSLAAAITQVTVSGDAVAAATATKFNFGLPAGSSSQLPTELTTIAAQVSAASAIDELVIGGLFAACLLLMLLCAGLAADRYAPELVLMRARGASTLQVTRRTLARSLWVSLPGIAAGVVLAARFGATGHGQWLLPAVNGVFAVAAVPARCAWRARRNGVWQASQRPEAAATPRRSARRIVAESTVLLLAAGAVVALRLRGVAGGSNQLGVAAPILVAVVASIVIGRLYPIPVRGMLPLATRRRGPVAFLSLSQAGRSGLAAILPALALVLTLTLAAFGLMLTQSVTAGQVASTWTKTGADAIFTAPGNDTISAAAQRYVDAVPGVAHTARAYIEVNTYQNSNFLLTTSARQVSLSVAVVDPRDYAALAKDTPWPAFPAAALNRQPGAVPILVSTAVAVSEPGLSVGATQTLSAYGIKIPVRIAGTIGTTPAFPAGGTFVVYPQWASAQIASVPGPNELLATGAHISVRRLRATAALHLRGDALLLRSTLLTAQLESAAEYAVRLFSLGSWAAAALSAVALFFGLGATAQSRRTLRTRMSAMGMSTRQARVLALFDPLALLCVAVAGMTVAVGLLSLISRQIIPLQSLTSSATSVPVSLSVSALAIPAAGAIVLALTVIAVEHTFAIKSESATALRYEEAG